MHRNFTSLILSVVSMVFALGLSVGGSAMAAEPSMMVVKIEAAKTKADHDEIAAYYEQEAKAAQAQADEHRKMAVQYKKAGYGKEGASLIRHCNDLVEKYKAVADENLKMAKMHRDMAAKARE